LPSREKEETPVTLRVLLADDHRIVREGLRALIEGQADMEVVGQARTGREAVRLARELAPDLVVMDVAMPDLNGVEAARQIVQANPEAKVLALSMHSDAQFVARMLEAGASGYLLKDGAFDELEAGIRQVAEGKTYLSPAIAGTVVKDYVRRMGGSETEDISPLSPREREVLQLLAEGLVSKQIAARLGLSVKTIETHRGRLMDKLGLRSVAELTKYAIRQGITQLED
jgi:DNA-binding NarL/FixJ family response regulator